MGAIRIALLGRLGVFVDDHPVFAGMPQTKPLELFAYLLIHRRRMHSREFLATLLWADLTPSQARKNLRKVLYVLQHFLTDACSPHMAQLLMIEQNWVAINLSIEFQLDVAVFEQAFALSQQKAGTKLNIQTAQEITNAVQLYEGELLPGLYSDWCLLERERLENMYLELLHTLMLHAEAEHNYQQAITYGLEILHQDRASERTYCDLMRLYYYSGNRTGALHTYAHCVAALDSELGVRPGNSTRLLYEQICQDDLQSAVESDPKELHRELGAPAEIHSQLQAAREELQAIMKQLQDDIYHMECRLRS